MLKIKHVNVDSTHSASIEWQDHNKFDIHIIPETIFNTEKTHLTEKVFKPIVMYQPFILFAGPNSLQYMRNYGFKTFNDVWDESYDTELNNELRFIKITKLIKRINALDSDEYTRLINKTTEIVKYNRSHFYSNKFKHQLLNELHNNIDTALDIRNEQFYTMPGGTLFYYPDLYFKKYAKLPISNTFYVSTARALSYVYTKSKAVGDEIVKKYSHLL
jgi:hypothetical protein